MASVFVGRLRRVLSLLGGAPRGSSKPGATKIRLRDTIGGVGGAQGIIFDRATGAMIGGSTPRKDGQAVAY